MYSIDIKWVLVEGMPWRRTDAKPLPEPIVTESFDAFMRHLPSMAESEYVSAMYYASIEI